MSFDYQVFFMDGMTVNGMWCFLENTREKEKIYGFKV